MGVSGAWMSCLFHHFIDDSTAGLPWPNTTRRERGEELATQRHYLGEGLYIFFTGASTYVW